MSVSGNKISKRIKKRKYSRTGCFECKRRKIKCDEVKPSCFNCVKASKVCYYTNKSCETDKSITKVREESSSGTLATDTLRKGFEYSRRNEILAKQASSSTLLATSSTDICRSENLNDSSQGTSNNLSNNTANDIYTATSVNEYNSPTNNSHISNSSIVPSKIISHNNPNDQELISRASVLAHDLSDLFDLNINDIPNEYQDIFFQNNSIDNSSNNLEISSHQLSYSLNTTISNAENPFRNSANINPIEFNDQEITDLIAAFDMIHGNNKNYLRIFYEKYSLWLMPLSPPNGSKNFFSKIIIYQAHNVPFLLNAIFAITASFEFKASKSPIDEYNKKMFINLSLKGLISIFENHDKVIENIEPLILTSLLLVMDTASTINGSWRDHLRGANNLFRKYLSSSYHLSHKTNSPTILLATTWFASFEIIAVIANPVGGSINKEDQLDDILLPILYEKPESFNLAIKYGFALPLDGFNIFLGQSRESIKLFIHFLKTSIKIRKTSSIKAEVDSDYLVELMSLFDKALKTHLVSSDGIIASDNAFSPNFNGLTYLPEECFGYGSSKKDSFAYSWFDISDKVHTRALYLVVLTNPMYFNLPIQNPILQNCVKKILNILHFFHDIDFTSLNDQKIEEILSSNPNLKDRRLLMLHSSLLICGLCCIDRIDRLKIELYFKCLIALGARTVEGSFNRILNCWKGHAGNHELDFVPYL